MTARKQAAEVERIGSDEHLGVRDGSCGCCFIVDAVALNELREAHRVAEAAVARMEALANAAKRDEATSLSRTFDGGTFGAWVSADQILAALTGADQ